MPMSTFTSSLGGRLISSACGVRNTVVTMKKMSSRNATSTIGVMSMRTPRRRLGRPKPFFLPFFDDRSGVSTAPTGTHLPTNRAFSFGLLEQTALVAEVGLHVEARGLG